MDLLKPKRVYILSSNKLHHDWTWVYFEELKDIDILYDEARGEIDHVLYSSVFVILENQTTEVAKYIKLLIS